MNQTPRPLSCSFFGFLASWLTILVNILGYTFFFYYHVCMLLVTRSSYPSSVALNLFHPLRLNVSLSSIDGLSILLVSSSSSYSSPRCTTSPIQFVRFYLSIWFHLLSLESCHVIVDSQDNRDQAQYFPFLS